MTLNQNQGHQTYIDKVDLKQGFNHVKLERSCFSGAREKDIIKVVVFSMRKYVNYLPWTYAKIKIAVYSWFAWCNQQSYNVSTQLDKK